jgi:beta-glucosidase/6-phospho-beta-glucosidase/beta-galactosidase
MAAPMLEHGHLDIRANTRTKTHPIEVIGAFESTFLPMHDVDVAESTGHVTRRLSDLMLLRACGVSRLRYPVRWHRIERSPGCFDWSETDEVFESLREHGWRVIVDLVHHTSYPVWLREGFADPQFPAAFERYAERFAERYSWVEEYTLFNEPFSTLLLCGHEAIWPPYGRGLTSFVALLENVLPSIGRAARMYQEMLPAARHVYIDSCEHHTAEGVSGRRYAALANDRRFFVLDALLGRIGSSGRRPFVEAVVKEGGGALLELPAAPVDVLGLDYYAHCQWHFGPERGHSPSPFPKPFADLIQEYADRYALPCMVTETNLRGYPSDRATWLKYTLEQCEIAVARGVDLEAYCWFPFIDSCDWDSLLFRCEGNIDPVGVFSVDGERHRHPSSMSKAYTLAAQGAPSSKLPAYVLQHPVAGWLAGYAPHMAHWELRTPPGHELGGGMPGDERYEPLVVRLGA